MTNSTNSTNMHTIAVPEFKQMISHLGFGMKEPIMAWGKPGVGKSEAVQQAAFEHGASLVDIRLSQYDSVDMRGIPVPSKETLQTVWFAPSTLPFKGNPAFTPETPVLLFLDEINSAAPAVAAVAYQLINDRRVGEHELNDNVVVVAAGNREGDRGVTNRMPLPLANRFTHVEIDVSTDAWCEWAQTANVPPVLIAFMQFRKDLLSTFDPAKSDKAFATPRTWVKAGRYHADPAMPLNVKMAAIAGAVGMGPAAEFHGFVDVWSKMIPIPEIIANPAKAPLPEDAAMTYAVSIALSGACNIDNIAAVWTYLQRLSPEFAVLSLKLALQRDMGLRQSPVFIDFAKKLKAIWQ